MLPELILFWEKKKKQWVRPLLDVIHSVKPGSEEEQKYYTMLSEVKVEIEALKVSEIRANALRYGENPHQKGVYFGNLDGLFEQLQ